MSNDAKLTYKHPQYQNRPKEQVTRFRHALTKLDA